MGFMLLAAGWKLLVADLSLEIDKEIIVKLT